MNGEWKIETEKLLCKEKFFEFHLHERKFIKKKNKKSQFLSFLFITPYHIHGFAFRCASPLVCSYYFIFIGFLFYFYCFFFLASQKVQRHGMDD